MKLIIVAMNPTIVVAPNFLVHHTAIVNSEKPIMSHRKGRPVIRKKIGEKIGLSTPHRAAHMDIAAISRLVKCAKTTTINSITIIKKRNTIIKVLFLAREISKS